MVHGNQSQVALTPGCGARALSGVLGWCCIISVKEGWLCGYIHVKT